MEIKLDKTEYFEKELEYIKNPSIKKFARLAIEDLPDYFFSIPASSTGKYHPNYALGEGGLLRHTRAAMRIAIELFQLDMFRHFSDDEKDIIIASLAIHDGRKNGFVKQTYTLADHPLLEVQALQQNDLLENVIPEGQFNMVCDNVACHMGQWNTDFKSNKEILPKPTTKMQNFVHLCDYLASRKCIEMNFDVELSS